MTFTTKLFPLPLWYHPSLECFELLPLFGVVNQVAPTSSLVAHASEVIQQALHLIALTNPWNFQENILYSQSRWLITSRFCPLLN